MYIVSHLKHDIVVTTPPWCLYPENTSVLEGRYICSLRKFMIEWMKHKGRNVLQKRVYYHDPISVLLHIVTSIQPCLNVLFLVASKQKFNLIMQTVQIWPVRECVFKLRSFWKQVRAIEFDFVFSVDFELTPQQCKAFAHCHLMSIVESESYLE
jgi:hypothetical protein